MKNNVEDPNQTDGDEALKVLMLELTKLRFEHLPSLFKVSRPEAIEGDAAVIGVVLRGHLFIESI
jgi:hypothetical protein